MAAWPDVLQAIIKSPLERQRLATALGVSHMTLTRWASGESRPQRSHIPHLLQAVHPDQRQELLDALEEQFPDLQTLLVSDTSPSIPSEFFAQVLSLRTTTTDSLRFWRISDVILKQVLAQLDPNGVGMAVRLVQCMPPFEGKVRSLRERMGKGTSPWTADLDHEVTFLGLESLSGYTVETRRSMNDDNVAKSKTFPSTRDRFEVSAAAHPILFEGRVAGCLLVSSTQEKFFSQQRFAMLAAFSNLLALAFNKEEFYRAEEIQIRVMPSQEEQRPILSTFRRRVMAKFQEAQRSSERPTNAAIEEQVWRDLENELIEKGAYLPVLSDADEDV